MYFLSISNSEPLKKLLQDADPPLEDILDQEALVQEIQASNQKLINYLARQNIFDAIISYVTDLPKDLDIDPLEPHRDLKMNKFPCVATKVLTAKSEIIANLFLGIMRSEKLMDIESETIPDDDVSDESLLKLLSNNDDTATDMTTEIPSPLSKFLKFLDHDSPLNPTLAGYFTQIMLYYLKVKEEIFSIMLYKEYFHALQKMTAHVYNDSIEELMEALFKVDFLFGEDTISSEEFSEKASLLINCLIKNIANVSKEDAGNSLILDRSENSAKILGHILAKPPNGNHELISNIFGEDCIQNLYSNLLELSNIGPISTLLCDLIKFYSIVPPVEDSPISHLTESKSQHCLWSEYYFTQATIKNLTAIIKILNIENKDFNPQAVSLQSGITSYPFGIARIKLLEVVHRIITIKSNDLVTKIVDSSLLEVVLNLMLRNPWNNILHEIVLKIVRFILFSQSEELIICLLKGARILDVIRAGCDESNIETKTKFKTVIQTGNVGHLVIMANLLEDSLIPVIQEFLESDPKWHDFSVGFLTNQNLRNKVLLYEKEISKQSTPLREFPRTQLPNPHYVVDEEEDVPKTDEEDEINGYYKTELLNNYEEEQAFENK